MAFPFTKKKTQVPEKIFAQERMTSKDIIAPASVRVGSENLDMAGRTARTFFVFSYPRYLSSAWLSSLVNLDAQMDISLFFHPIDTGNILKTLRRKVTEVQSELMEREEKGLVRSPELEITYQDLEELRNNLQSAQEKMFDFGLYITVYGDSQEEVQKLETTLRSMLESRLIYIKPALYQQKAAFNSVLPYGRDLLQVRTPMNTAPLSSVYPFVSFDLSSNEGILYGINRHNNSLILFDRFSLPNANEVLFATSGAGKSIRGSDPVLIRQNGEVTLRPIESVVEGLIRERGAIPIDEELEGVVEPNIEVYSFNKDLKAEWSRVTVAARKEAPKTFYKFTTRSGREITTTGDHNMVVLRNGKARVAKSTEVKAGEYIPLPRSVSSAPQDGPKSINLLELLKGSPEGVYVRGAHSFIDKHYDALKGLAIDPKLDRYRYLYRQGRAMPLPYFFKILSFLGVSLDSINTNSLSVCSRNGKTEKSIPTNMPLSRGFFRLLGYIVAEGTIRRDVVIISNLDKKLLSDAGGTLRTLGVPFFYTDTSLNIASKVFVEALWVLGCTGKSKRKHAPSLVFEASREHQAAFLAGYFEGDGGVEHSSVAASSKSKTLIGELSYLLYGFGIIGRLSKTRKKATNQHWKRRRPYWKCVVSGQEHLKAFAEEIGFVSARKQGALHEILLKEGNTNVDLIPETDQLFKELYDLFGFQLHGIPEVSDWKRRSKFPSPQSLKKVLCEIEARIQHFKDLETQLRVLNELPELSQIVAKGAEDKALNRLLWQELGQSWRTAKTKGLPPFSQNAFKMIRIVSGQKHELSLVKHVLHQGFQEMDIPIKYQEGHLQNTLVAYPEGNTAYHTIHRASRLVWERYQDIRQHTLPRVEELVSQLKALAESHLFWDEITEVQEVENKKDAFVYDLTVDNEVFLAGYGGMFVHNSYAVKLEVLRYLMMGVDAIILDPENEYRKLAEAAGGSFFPISLGSEHHINPFDLPEPREDEDPEDVLRSGIINLVGLMRIMLGGLSPEEDAIIDRALTETYALKDITSQSDPKTWKEKTPLMQDLEQVLEGMEGAESLVRRIQKFTKGTYANFFNQPTNISLKESLVVFGIRDMEEGLRPIAMFIIMRYIWNMVRSELKKRLFVLDEAWWLMQSEDGASFLYGLVKRARKYWLGVSTVTQDVGDFLRSSYGRPIITNSSLSILMKQSPATIDVVQKAFNLSSEERALLLSTEVGEGIFFAGQKHVAMRVVASPTEHQIITTDPQELRARAPQAEEQTEPYARE